MKGMIFLLLLLALAHAGIMLWMFLGAYNVL